MFFDWLKRSMPRSLYGRAALILVVPVLALQLVVSVAFIQRHFERVTQQMTQSAVLELRFLVDSVEAAGSPEAAREIAGDIGGHLALSVVLPVEGVPEADDWRWDDLTARIVAGELRAGLPTLERVQLPDSRRVELWIGTAQGTMQVTFDRRRLSATNPHQLLVLIVVFGALMTLIAYLFLRNQLRPIKRMAAAAEEYGRGRIVPYAPSGATEVRAAGAAFLSMRNRIERQTQARTMMLSGVSHDLRTPLTRLRLGLSLLDPKEAEPLIRDVDDMQRLTDAFLDFARDGADDEAETVDPTAIVADVVEMARRGGGEVRQVGEVSGPAVPLRPMAIRRAVENLVGNALRYGDRAEVAVEFGEKTVRIVVEDDGPGIPEAQRDESMRPFTRLDPARNQDKGPGVGLGLAIVADVARSHGGLLRLGASDRLGGLRAELVIAR